MHDLEQYKALRHALLQVRQEIRQGIFVDNGLCSRIADKLKSNLDGDYYLIQAINKKFGRLLEHWPEHSGSVNYPIGQNSEDGYYLYVMVPSYWQGSEAGWYYSKSSAYGRKRRELLDWLIGQVVQITGYPV